MLEVLLELSVELEDSADEELLLLPLLLLGPVLEAPVDAAELCNALAPLADGALVLLELKLELEELTGAALELVTVLPVLLELDCAPPLEALAEGALVLLGVLELEMELELELKPLEPLELEERSPLRPLEEGTELLEDDGTAPVLLERDPLLVELELDSEGLPVLLRVPLLLLLLLLLLLFFGVRLLAVLLLLLLPPPVGGSVITCITNDIGGRN
jgi:hypothetical protein